MNFENLYPYLPIWGQNWSISLYGLRLHRIRHGKDYSQILSQIKNRQNFSLHELHRYQLDTLKNLIVHAAQNVPYYKQLFNDLGISPDLIQNKEDLRKIPFLEKDTIRKNNDTLIDVRYDKKSLLAVHTSGTTGTPLAIYCTPEVRKTNYAFYERFLSGAGITYRGRRITLGGRTIIDPETKKPPFWRYSYFQKNLLFSIFHLSDDNIPVYIDKLQQYKPDYIDAYPTSLYLIARYAMDHHINLSGVTKGITTSAEKLQPIHRKTIEKTFNTPIYDQYGSAEMCAFIGQCNQGSYHIHSDYGIIEVIREDGKPAKAGDVGEFVCTGLINPVMPLIRYRIGDMGSLSTEECPCGSPFPVVEEIIGRSDDYIVTPDGRKISRMGRTFYDFPIKEMQYVQLNKESLEVLIVKDVNFKYDHEKKALDVLRKRLGHDISIKIIYVDHINREKSGKFKTVISYVK